MKNPKNDNQEFLFKLMQQWHICNTAHIAISWVFEHKEENPHAPGKHYIHLSEERLFILLSHVIVSIHDVFHGLNNVQTNYVIPNEVKVDYDNCLSFAQGINQELDKLRNKGVGHRAANIANYKLDKNLKFGTQTDASGEVTAFIGDYDIRDIHKKILELVDKLNTVIRKVNSP